MSVGQSHVAVPDEVKEFYNQLSKLQDEIKSLVEVSGVDLDKDMLRQHSEQKVPLMNFIKLEIIQKDLQKSIENIVEHFSEVKKEAKEDLSKIEEVLLELSEEPVKFVERVLWQKNNQLQEIVDKNGLNPVLFSLVVVNVVKPFIAAYAEKVQDKLEELKWIRSHCPVCGWEPSMAKNSKDDNKRMLHCSFCDSEWFFKKLQCPRCDSEDFAKLKTLKVENEEVYELATCDECKGYIKVLNEKSTFGKKNMALEDVRTIYLDMLAEKEGYQKGSNNGGSEDLS